MYILHHALKNLIRNKGRNILIGLVLTAIIAASVVGLVINNTASAVIDDYRTRFSSQVRIIPDFGFFRARYGGMGIGYHARAVIPSEQALAFAESQYLSGYVMTALKNLGSDYIYPIGDRDLFPSERISGFGMEGDAPVRATFRVMGNMWDEFETGERTMREGRMPQAVGEAVISHELAELNGLSVGDEIEMLHAAFIPEIGAMYIRNVSITYTISGIFLDFTDIEAGFFGAPVPMFHRRNEILTTLGTITQSLGDGAVAIMLVTPTYYLRDPAYLPYFEAEIRTKGLADTFHVSADIDSFRAIVEPVEGLRSVFVTFVVIVLVLGTVILVLLSWIAIRERKYEIGVLRAMGMKKGKVVRGFLYEMGVLTIICLTLGLVAGAAVSQPVADNLLQQQVAIAGRAVPVGQYTADLPLGFIAPVEPLSEISLHLGAVTMVQIAAIALLLAFIASAMGIVNITRYEPIKILVERDR
ncbi:MAG: ABC transporter permease [Oscillospiraceae bacterium]|nr:ABC transporter permease [Oscillospiraceae bacterium]